MATDESVSLREMTTADIPAGLSLCRAARWNQTDRDWRRFLTVAPHGALVAEAQGRVVGTVATLPYGSFAWISMVLVDPAARGHGVGTMLLERGLELIPHGVTPRLDATPAGEVLYRKLGFAGEYRIQRWYRVEATTQQRDGVRALGHEDWLAIADMDRRAFGESRIELLRGLAADAPEYARVVPGDGGVRGYMFGRHGHVREHLGPIVAQDAQAATMLLHSCLAAHPDRPVFVDALDDQHAFVTALEAAGFAVERPFLRMHRGPLTSPGDPTLVYAIAGPELG